MSIHFRPFLGLTLFTVFGVILLSSLGVWQYQRLQWKTALLSDVTSAADAAPFDSLLAVGQALDAGEPVNFRRIGLSEAIISSDIEPLWVYQSRSDGIFWRGFWLISDPVQFADRRVYGAFVTIGDADKSGFRVQEVAEARDLVGYIRLPKKTGWLTPGATPEKNRYFLFNQTPEWREPFSDDASQPLDVRFYLDIQPGAESDDGTVTDRAARLPPLKPNIPNNHFDYMLTWFVLALTLCVFYFILHYRAGRLRWGHAV